MPNAIVAGGGLAGLAAAAALAGAGFEVDLFEARPFLGGRATSYALPASEAGEVIDNCQHVLMRCCLNLLNFYNRLGVGDQVQFYREFFLIEPGGRTSVLKASPLPAPAHFAPSFFRLAFLDLRDKLGIARAMRAISRQHARRTDLDRITMLAWLRETKQTQAAIDRFWAPVLVSAINEDLGRMSALHGFQVFRLGFLVRSDSYQMGIPSVPLGELYSEERWRPYRNVRLHLRETVEQFVSDNGQIRCARTSHGEYTAGAYVAALPFERVQKLLPAVQFDFSSFTHSPITGIHLWFDRPITQLPHATLLDRTIQWMFNKEGGRHIQLVVSASRSLLDMPRAEVIDLALRELAEFFPAVSRAKLEKAHVVKEVRATFSAIPGLEAQRPPACTPLANLFLAGDWTHSGWPATMEGAVRSGYLAAEAVTAAAGQPRQFVFSDIG